MLAVVNWHFGMAYQFHPQDQAVLSSWTASHLMTGPTRCLKTLVNNYQHALHNTPQE
jgi:hypothetical protein